MRYFDDERDLVMWVECREELETDDGEYVLAVGDSLYEVRCTFDGTIEGKLSTWNGTFTWTCPDCGSQRSMDVEVKGDSSDTWGEIF